MTRFTCAGGGRILLLLILASCATAPKHETLTSFADSHPECKIKPDDLNLSIFRSTGESFARGITSTTSMMVTTVGYATDVVIVGGVVIGVAYLCQYGCSDIVAPQIFNSYSSVGKWTYKETSSWRCPYVDHISQAVRKSAKCNYQHGNLVEAYAQLNFLNNNEIMSDCVSHLEVEKINNLKNTFTSASGSN